VWEVEVYERELKFKYEDCCCDTIRGGRYIEGVVVLLLIMAAAFMVVVVVVVLKAELLRSMTVSRDRVVEASIVKSILFFGDIKASCSNRGRKIKIKVDKIIIDKRSS
jgi:hypothetical protein